MLRVMPSSSASIVPLAAAASRSLLAVASHAIGFAEPRPGVHSSGFSACEGGGEDQDYRLQAGGNGAGVSRSAANPSRFRVPPG
jgi:hypothetical protein